MFHFDLFNHSPEPGAKGDWDDARDLVVIKACRAHEAGEEVCIQYGDLSNPLLFRTYGFTLSPSLEPSWTCTFSDAEVIAACKRITQRCAAGAEELVGVLGQSDLDNLHLNSSQVSNTLAALVEVCAGVGGDVVALLRELCSCRMAALEACKGFPLLQSALAALGHVDTTPITSKSDDIVYESPLLVQLSEYMCVLAHLEALKQVSGSHSATCPHPSLPEWACDRAAGLCREFQLLSRAGALGNRISDDRSLESCNDAS